MLILMYITNRPEIARIAEESGVDRIFVDLETLGKAERQVGMNTVQSHHTLDDVRIIRRTISRSDLLVRSNPIHDGLRQEIDTIVANGADIVMLPYFKSVVEAERFIEYVGGRAKVSLLIETAEAVEKIEDILALEGIDEIHIGLNDLHLAYHQKFMFELLADGTVDRLASKILDKCIPYGFGGIAKLGMGALPAENIIREHYRLNSTRAILSRSFCNTDLIHDLAQIRDIFMSGIREIRELEAEIIACKNYFSDNREKVCRAVHQIVKGK